MFGRYRGLSDEGVLGLNKRNGDYILRFNPRRLYPLVDDKLKTKRLALAAGIVPSSASRTGASAPPSAAPRNASAPRSKRRRPRSATRRRN